MTHKDFISPEAGLSFIKWQKKMKNRRFLWKPVYYIGCGVLNVIDVLWFVADYFAKNV